MIGVLLVSHGKMAEGMKDSVNMIVGDQASFETLSLVPGQDVQDLRANILNKSKELDSGDGVLILVDIYGASPYNASMFCTKEWNDLGLKAHIITGMSLPMAITAVCNRDFSTLSQLAQEVVTTGQENIQDAIAAKQEAAHCDEDDY